MLLKGPSTQRTPVLLAVFLTGEGVSRDSAGMSLRLWEPELDLFFWFLRLLHLPPTELLFSLMESWAEDALPVASLSLIMLS